MVFHQGNKEGAAPEVGTAETDPHHWRRFTGMAISFILLVAFSYLYGLHTDWGNADLVRGLLQGSDMARGNVLLNHWYSSADSFWTIDLVFFTVGVLLVGAKIVLLHMISAIVWAALILTGMYIAVVELRRPSRFASTLTVFLVLGIPSTLLAANLSPSMMHVGTVLYTLIAFIGLRKGRFDWGWSIAVTLFAAGQLGDPLIVAYGLVPAFAAGILESIRARNWRTGISTSSAPFIALCIAASVRLVTVHLGAYRLIPAFSSIESSGQVLKNLHIIIPNGISLLGSDRVLRPVEFHGNWKRSDHSESSLLRRVYWWERDISCSAS